MTCAYHAHADRIVTFLAERAECARPAAPPPQEDRLAQQPHLSNLRGSHAT